MIDYVWEEDRMDQRWSQGLRLNCGFVKKLNIYGETFGKLSGDDDLFDDLLVYLHKNFLEVAGNFHTLKN